MKHKIILTILAGLFCISVLAGCSSKSTARDIEEHNSPVVETYAAEDYDFGYKQSLSGASNGSGGSTGAIEYTPEVPESSPGTLDNPNINPNTERLLIRTVSMVTETKDIETVKNDIETQVKSCGGYIENANMSGTGKNRDLRTVNYTIRIPADKVDGLISQIGNSCTVLSSNENSTDVTLEYVDTQAKIESLRVEYDQLIKLLKEADDLDTIIVLQNRLSEVRYQIESYESRIRVLENQVTYATLNLTIREVLEETTIEPAHIPTFGEQIAEQFKETWENTKEFGKNLVLVIIACLPGIIFLGINAIIVVVIVKSVKKKRRKKVRGVVAPNIKDIPVKPSTNPVNFDKGLMLEGEAILPENEIKEEPIQLAGDVTISDSVKPVKDYKDPKYKGVRPAKLTTELPIECVVKEEKLKEELKEEIKQEEKLSKPTSADILNVVNCDKNYLKEKKEENPDKRPFDNLMNEDRANEEDENI